MTENRSRTDLASVLREARSEFLSVEGLSRATGLLTERIDALESGTAASTRDELAAVEGLLREILEVVSRRRWRAIHNMPGGAVKEIAKAEQALAEFRSEERLDLIYEAVLCSEEDEPWPSR